VIGEFRSFLNSDGAWTIVMARRVLAGERLYRDTLEINPPLIVWLHLPLVWLERLSSIPAAVMVRVALYAGIAASSVASMRLALPGCPSSWRQHPWRIVMLVASVLIVLPLGAFSEREQLITLLLLPSVALAVARCARASVGGTTSVLVGAAAGVACSLKPQYLAVWVLLGAVRSAHLHSLRLVVEDAAALLTGLAYVGAVLIFTPEFLQVVRTFGPAYAHYTARTRSRILFASPEVYWWLVAAMAWWVRRRRDGDPAGAALMAACLGSLAAVMIQGKGWLYQFIPLSTFGLILAEYAAALRAASGATRPARLARVVALLLLVIISSPLAVRTVAINWQRATGHTERRREITDLLALIRTVPSARSIQVLSSEVSAFPLAELARLSEHHTLPALWVPMTVYRSWLSPGKPVAVNRPQTMSGAERAAFEATVRDIERAPDLLLVESRERNQLQSAYPGGFDHLAYYGQDPAVRAVLGGYRLVGSSHGFRLYERVRQP
jgi:hypothetical protein